MSADEYVGSIVLEIDGREIEVTSLNVDITTGRKLVKTMNKTGRAKGFSRGIAEYKLSLSAVVPLDGNIDWAAIENAKVTQYPLNGSGGKRTSYMDCFTTETGAKYTVDNEAMIDITMNALREVIE
ncbi:phage tail protein [Yersinia enterocolitica]|uniref:phage tail protein n=1 Tax=Yersinia enterocolitica TaxID=630 RepID=UPI0029C39B3E|nr:phage tail protein [Yersinia enterocolitica]EME3601646.1 phage tail protein [Yersinia enterocolitica]HEI6960306.1 phage tail protein [Yersinia enterocolitica]HEN3444047.1 phage tail protein [Yersinia enterocolitica]